MDNDSERVSLFLSETLDSLGNSKDSIRFRRRAYKEINLEYDRVLGCYGLKAIIDGSTTEGIASPFESSCDILIVKNNVQCYHDSENGHSQFQYHEDKLTFISEQEAAPPGYTRLTLKQRPKMMLHESDIYKSTFGQDKIYLWSLVYFNVMADKFKDRNTPLVEIGPLIRRSMKAHIGNFSINFPLQYVDEQLPNQLRSRQRQYGWPSEELIHEISRQEVFVVPQGSPNSEMSHLEWKISFRQAELRLFQELNLTQVKLYILLKMIANSTLRSISKALTPYLMKNIVFWMAQLYPSDIFHDRHLLLLVLTAIGMLYNGIKAGNISCYLMLKRNLISQNMDVATRHDLLRMLSILQQEKACMFLRCEKLKGVMEARFRSPEIVERYKTERDKLEIVVLLLDVIQSKYLSYAGKKKTYIKHIFQNGDWRQLVKVMYDIVLPEWGELQFMGESTHNIVASRIREILR